jgi:hypothetical protein
MLTPNLTTRALWSSPKTPLELQEMGEGNENLVYTSPWDFKSSFTCRKILWHGTSSFTSHPRGKCAADFIALKNQSPWPGLNPQPLCPMAVTPTTTPPSRLCSNVCQNWNVARYCWNICGSRCFLLDGIETTSTLIFCSSCCIERVCNETPLLALWFVRKYVMRYICSGRRIARCTAGKCSRSRYTGTVPDVVTSEVDQDCLGDPVQFQTAFSSCWTVSKAIVFL